MTALLVAGLVVPTVAPDRSDGATAAPAPAVTAEVAPGPGDSASATASAPEPDTARQPGASQAEAAPPPAPRPASAAPQPEPAGVEAPGRAEAPAVSAVARPAGPEAGSDATDAAEAPAAAAVPAPPVTPDEPAPAQPGPASAQAQAAPVPLTAPGVVTGTLVRVWLEPHVDDEADHAEHEHEQSTDGTGAVTAAATLQAWVETADVAYPVAPSDVVGVADGSTVTVDLGAPPAPDAAHPVRGVLEVAAAQQVEGAVTFGEGSTDEFGVAAASVVHDVTVVLAVPRGATKDATTTSAVAANVSTGANGFWTQQSRSQRGLRVVAQHGWTTLTRDCSDPFALWNEVAAKVGWQAGARKHLLVYLPTSAGCGAGLGTVGSGPDSGGRSWVSVNSVSIIAHELGHNFGLGHSDGLLCTGSADGVFASGAWKPGCASYGYRDYYDVMGVSWGPLGSLAAPHADALGLLRSTEKLVTTEPVRVHLVPASTNGLRVLRVDDPGGTYYVEYRVASGWDSWLSGNTRGLDAGVIVHRRAPNDARKSLLLDGSVTSGTRSDDWKAALRAGTSLTTASGVTRITVERQSSTGATLVVHRNGVGPAAVQAPAGGVQVEVRSPAGATAAAGTTVFSGVATAPEGTLLWDVRQDGVRKASGTATTGANGRFDTFQVPVALPAGTFTFRVWVPDESAGESQADPLLLSDQVTITVS